MAYFINIFRSGATWLFNTLNANGVLVLLGSWFSGGSSDDNKNYLFGLTALITALVTYIVLKKMR